MKSISALILVALLAASGCSTNPVTGKQELNLVSEQWELNTGKQQYLPMRQSQGGDYVVDPKVEAYVNEVGQRLAKVSDRKLPYEFNVLNSSVPNAWALPGGKIAINRGLLTELKSESELAAVLGHEIVHAAARHGAQGVQRGVLMQGVVLGTTIATRGENYANLARLGAGLGASLVNTKYGRDAERESDHYGMEYMARAGYDPQGAVDLQRTFVKLKDGKQQNWLKGLFSSHPPSQERVDNNIKIAAGLPKGGDVGRDRYAKMMARLTKSEPAYEAYDKAQKALSKGEKKTALNLINKAIKIEPREGHFYSFLGDLHYKSNRFKSARTQYTKAIGLNEEFFYYHLRRGLVNNKLDNGKQAKVDLERSNQLLPTANAFNALGDLSRDAGDISTAKEYYASAAEHQSSAGKAALASLVELDLPDNPQKYIKLRNVSDSLGRWFIEVSNPTPKTVKNLVIEVQYPDGFGGLRKSRKEISGSLASGAKQRLNTRLLIDPKLVKYYKSRILSAEVAQ
ncbi:MAG: M48 family metalloprotease [Motiliproteus sp.]|nr:M48 family metalloprotease [Motiliproteus sp.]MCW9052113.1 M48 family metalloprotease [Motiliproteus sp.]